MKRQSKNKKLALDNQTVCELKDTEMEKLARGAGALPGSDTIGTDAAGKC